MATGGEVPGQSPGRARAEDQDYLKCQPCLEDGHLHEAVGMCVDCDDNLCETCYQSHKIPKPCKNHKLIDIDQMRQRQIRATTKDYCTEKCQIHDYEITKYYCIKHRKFGCTLCVTSDHKTCETVHYIPHVAKELANNEEYMHAEKRLNSALDTFKTVSKNVSLNFEELETSCAEAVNSIHEYRRKVEEALSKIEADLIENVQAIKAVGMKTLTAKRDKYKAAEEELQAASAKTEALRNSQQNCGAYINMMKTQERLTALRSQIDQAIEDASYKKRHIDFVPNLDTSEMMKLTNTLGAVTGCGQEINLPKNTVHDLDKESASNRKQPKRMESKQDLNVAALSELERIKRLIHMHDLNVKTKTDQHACYISGLTFLPDGILVLVDNRNSSIKISNVNSGKTASHLKLHSAPWDVTAISSSKVAVTLPDAEKVAFVTVGDNAMRMIKTLDVDGQCHGVDYKNDKIAVSFTTPDKVQVLTLQGSVLHTIFADKLGNQLFDDPLYLAYGQDDTTLYISNSRDNIVCLSLDIHVTAVAKYTNDNQRWDPLQPAVDNNGDVLVCAGNVYNAVHQINKDCEKIRVLLTQDDGLGHPRSICFSSVNDMIFVGRYKRDSVKVYKIERGTR